MKESKLETCNYECKIDSKQDDTRVNVETKNLLKKIKQYEKDLKELRDLNHKKEL